MRRLRPIALAGIGAGLLCNYWVLEAWLAERSDFGAAWISDLASRSETTGWRFVGLGVLSGLAIAGFALALLAAESRAGGPAAKPPRLRRGLWALFAIGAFTVLAAAAPLSCGEDLDPSCRTTQDALDLLHAIGTGGEIVATVLAFALIGLALRDRRLGRVTLGLGALWLVLAVLTGVAYLGGALESVGGALQRIDQVLFGAWLALLGLTSPGPPADEEKGRPGSWRDTRDRPFA